MGTTVHLADEIAALEVEGDTESAQDGISHTGSTIRVSVLYSTLHSCHVLQG